MNTTGKIVCISSDMEASSCYKRAWGHRIKFARKKDQDSCSLVSKPSQGQGPGYSVDERSRKKAGSNERRNYCPNEYSFVYYFLFFLVHEYVRALDDPELMDAIIGDDKRSGDEDLSDSEVPNSEKIYYEKVRQKLFLLTSST